MFFKLFLLFTLLPVVELALLIKVGSRMGVWPTLALVIGTGLLGAALARAEGFRVIRKIHHELNAGQMPAREVVDGLLILAAGLVLVTPGLITDVIGFVLLIPLGRRVVRHYLIHALKRAVRDAQVRVQFHGDIRPASGRVVEPDESAPASEKSPEVIYLPPRE